MKLTIEIAGTTIIADKDKISVGSKEYSTFEYYTEIKNFVIYCMCHFTEDEQSQIYSMLDGYYQHRGMDDFISSLVPSKFEMLMRENIELFHSWLNDLNENDIYYRKDLFWCGIVGDLFNEWSGTSLINNFRYLVGNGDTYYYDVIVVMYLGNWYGFPVPILADMLGVDDCDICSSFPKELKEDIDNVQFI